MPAVPGEGRGDTLDELDAVLAEAIGLPFRIVAPPGTRPPRLHEILNSAEEPDAVHRGVPAGGLPALLEDPEFSAAARCRPVLLVFADVNDAQAFTLAIAQPGGSA